MRVQNTAWLQINEGKYARQNQRLSLRLAPEDRKRFGYVFSHAPVQVTRRVYGSKEYPRREEQPRSTVRFGLRIQPVDATVWPNRSAGRRFVL